MVCRRLGVGDVARAPALVEHALHGGLDPAGLLGAVERIGEEHGRREDLRKRVGDTLASDVGCRARRGLEERHAIAQARGGEHTERARDLRGLVGEDVAEHVLGHHNVKVGRAVDELHGGVVDQQVLKLHVGVLGVVHAVHHLAPHAGGLQHVALVHARHLVAALAGGLKGLARDALHLVLAILHHVVGALTGRAIGTGARFVVKALATAKVHATGELAHEHHVHALDDLGTQGGGTGQGIVDLHRAQVGVEAQLLAYAQQALLGARCGRVGGVPLGAAHARQQHGIGGLGALQGLGRQRVAARIDGGTADQVVLELELKAGLGSHGGEHLLALGDNLGADAVARQAADLIGLLHVAPPRDGARPRRELVLERHDRFPTRPGRLLQQARSWCARPDRPER